MSALRGARLMAFAGATDLERARDFYAGTLGLEVDHQDGFACQFRCGDTLLRVTRVDEVVPAPYTVLGWRVEDIESSIRELAARGVEFQRYDALSQDELGAWSAPGGARVAWFRDPDGNTLSIAQIA